MPILEEYRRRSDQTHSEGARLRPMPNGCQGGSDGSGPDAPVLATIRKRRRDHFQAGLRVRL